MANVETAHHYDSQNPLHSESFDHEPAVSSNNGSSPTGETDDSLIEDTNVESIVYAVENDAPQNDEEMQNAQYVIIEESELNGAEAESVSEDGGTTQMIYVVTDGIDSDEVVQFMQQEVVPLSLKGSTVEGEELNQVESLETPYDGEEDKTYNDVHNSKNGQELQESIDYQCSVNEDCVEPHSVTPEDTMDISDVVEVEVPFVDSPNLERTCSATSTVCINSRTSTPTDFLHVLPESSLASSLPQENVVVEKISYDMPVIKKEILDSETSKFVFETPQENEEMMSQGMKDRGTETVDTGPPKVKKKRRRKKKDKLQQLQGTPLQYPFPFINPDGMAMEQLQCFGWPPPAGLVTPVITPVMTDKATEGPEESEKPMAKKKRKRRRPKELLKMSNVDNIHMANDTSVSPERAAEVVAVQSRYPIMCKLLKPQLLAVPSSTPVLPTAPNNIQGPTAPDDPNTPDKPVATYDLPPVSSAQLSLNNQPLLDSVSQAGQTNPELKKNRPKPKRRKRKIDQSQTQTSQWSSETSNAQGSSCATAGNQQLLSLPFFSPDQVPNYKDFAHLPVPPGPYPEPFTPEFFVFCEKLRELWGLPNPLLQQPPVKKRKKKKRKKLKNQEAVIQNSGNSLSRGNNPDLKDLPTQGLHNRLEEQGLIHNNTTSSGLSDAYGCNKEEKVQDILPERPADKSMGSMTPETGHKKNIDASIAKANRLFDKVPFICETPFSHPDFPPLATEYHHVIPTAMEEPQDLRTDEKRLLNDEKKKKKKRKKRKENLVEGRLQALPSIAGMFPLTTGSSPAFLGIPPVPAPMSSPISGMPLVSAGMSPAIPGMPPVSAGMSPTIPGMPPVSAGMSPAIPGMPSVSAGMSPAIPGMPSVSAGMSPTIPGMPPAKPGMPPISAAIPPAIPGMPPASAAMPLAVSSMPPVSPGLSPAIHGMPSVTSGTSPAIPGMAPVTLGKSGMPNMSNILPPLLPGMPPVSLGMLPIPLSHQTHLSKKDAKKRKKRPKPKTSMQMTLQQLVNATITDELEIEDNFPLSSKHSLEPNVPEVSTNKIREKTHQSLKNLLSKRAVQPVNDAQNDTNSAVQGLLALNQSQPLLFPASSSSSLPSISSILPGVSQTVMNPGNENVARSSVSNVRSPMQQAMPEPLAVSNISPTSLSDASQGQPKTPGNTAPSLRPEAHPSLLTDMYIQNWRPTGQYRCVMCSYSCVTKNYLFRHWLVHHNNELFAYRCPYCDFRYTYRDGVTRHVGRWHKDKPKEVVVDGPVEDEAVRQFKALFNIDIQRDRLHSATVNEDSQDHTEQHLMPSPCATIATDSKQLHQNLTGSESVAAIAMQMTPNSSAHFTKATISEQQQLNQAAPVQSYLSLPAHSTSGHATVHSTYASPPKLDNPKTTVSISVPHYTPEEMLPVKPFSVPSTTVQYATQPIPGSVSGSPGLPRVSAMTVESHHQPAVPLKKRQKSRMINHESFDALPSVSNHNVSQPIMTSSPYLPSSPYMSPFTSRLPLLGINIPAPIPTPSVLPPSGRNLTPPANTGLHSRSDPQLSQPASSTLSKLAVSPMHTDEHSLRATQLVSKSGTGLQSPKTFTPHTGQKYQGSSPVPAESPLKAYLISRMNSAPGSAVPRYEDVIKNMNKQKGPGDSAMKPSTFETSDKLISAQQMKNADNRMMPVNVDMKNADNRMMPVNVDMKNADNRMMPVNVDVNKGGLLQQNDVCSKECTCPAGDEKDSSPSTLRVGSAPTQHECEAEVDNVTVTPAVDVNCNKPKSEPQKAGTELRSTANYEPAMENQGKVGQSESESIGHSDLGPVVRSDTCKHGKSAPEGLACSDKIYPTDQLQENDHDSQNLKKKR